VIDLGVMTPMDKILQTAKEKNVNKKKNKKKEMKKKKTKRNEK